MKYYPVPPDAVLAAAATILTLALLALVAILPGCSPPAEGEPPATPVSLIEAGGTGYADLVVYGTRVRVETSHVALDVAGREPIYCPTLTVDVGILHVSGAIPGINDACCDRFGCLDMTGGVASQELHQEPPGFPGSSGGISAGGSEQVGPPVAPPREGDGDGGYGGDGGVDPVPL